MKKDTEFYEVLLKGVIDYFYNNVIGENENSMMDGDEYDEWTEEELIDYIIQSILTEKDYLYVEDSCMVMEPKHVRFLGKEKITKMVIERVKSRHQKEGKWEWEK